MSQSPEEIVIVEDEEIVIVEEIDNDHPVSEKKSKPKHAHKKKHHASANWWKGAVGVLWGVGLLVLSVLGLSLPVLALYILVGATSLLTLYLGGESYIKGIKKLFNEKKLSMNVLYMISTLTIIGVSIARFFFPALPIILEAAPLVLGLWHIGKGIEHSLKKKVNSNLKMCDAAPKTISRQGKTGSLEECSVNDLKPGDIIVVNEGELIPVDGKCLNKSRALYTTKINGSPSSKEFKKGEPVLAGMVLAEGVNMRIEVTKDFKHSYLARVDEHIEHASKAKAPIQLFTDKILQYFIPGLLVIAAISAITIGFLFTPALAITCAISVLVSACPCALGLVTPLAVKIGIKKAADLGVHFKNGETIQAAGTITAVVSDLHGTLTKGTPEVASYQIKDKNISEKEFFRYLAILETHSEHPTAKAILKFVNSQGVSVSKDLAEEVDSSCRSGIKARIDGEYFIIGNESMLERHGINIPENQKKKRGAVTYLVKGKEIIGKILIRDPLRKDAIATIRALQASGKEVHLCTGADISTAEYYANELGIPESNIKAGCVAAIGDDEGEVTKTSYILELQERGLKVAMFGNGINDAAAILTSNLGVAVHDTGDEITQENAGAVIQNEALLPIVSAFKIAQQTKNNIIQNLIISLGYNTTIILVAAGILVFLGITLNPIIGIALMVVETTIVLLNAYRFKQQEVTLKSDYAENNDSSVQDKIDPKSLFSSKDFKQRYNYDDSDSVEKTVERENSNDSEDIRIDEDSIIYSPGLSPRPNLKKQLIKLEKILAQMQEENPFFKATKQLTDHANLLENSLNLEDKELLTEVVILTKNLVGNNSSSQEGLEANINRYEELMRQVEQKSEKSGTGLGKKILGWMGMILGAAIFLAAALALTAFLVTTFPVSLPTVTIGGTLLATLSTTVSTAISTAAAAATAAVSTVGVGSVAGVGAVGLAGFIGGFFCNKKGVDSNKAQQWHEVSDSMKEIEEFLQLNIAN